MMMHRFRQLALLGMLVLTACESFVIPPSPTPIPPTFTPLPPTSTPARVAFPTVTPTVTEPTVLPTISIPTATPNPRGTAPVVQLVSPVASAQISANQTSYVVVYAADDAGIARIELFVEGVLARAETAPIPAPRVFSTIIPWTPTQIGAHTLRVVAYDVENRASVPDEVTVTVLQNARRPTAIIVYPIGTPQIELGSVLQIYGVATDDASVTQVELWVNNQLHTYLAASNTNGQSVFPFAFTWHALMPGTHTFFVRARDTYDQTTDSAPLKVMVVDTHTPTVNLSIERTSALVNEPITITVTALDVSGIQRIEFLNGKEIFYTAKSSQPMRQTALTAQVLWQSASPGDFQISARAYNANGNFKDTVPQTISVLRAGQPTPTLAPTVTPTRTRAPRATATPRAQPPPPPTVEIVSPHDNFTGSAPLRVTFSARSNAELERIELWGQTSTLVQPQLICTIDARASTQKTAQCDWNAPTAGVVSLFVQAMDIYRQTARSAPITGFLSAPVMATPTVSGTR
ncbi:MAG: Ig-like domain-containing protein [Anaerolineae bacterium]|nr:Ig-like domain-containing protein [Anaerolineae bacterium]